jgi:sarcosine oxidase subunit gamma
MLERRSALAHVEPYSSAVLKIGEARGFSITQVAGFSPAFDQEITPITGALPPTANTAITSNGRTIFRTAPLQFWLIGPEQDDLAQRLLAGQRLASHCVVTPLSHSRTRIFIEGAPARDVLLKGIPIDLHEDVFTPGMFAMTGLHHTPVLLHCVSANRFELYAMRTFAENIWEWVIDAAKEYAVG